MRRLDRVEVARQAGKALCLSLLGLLGFTGLGPARAQDADLTVARRQLLSGQYAACLSAAESALRPGSDNEEWPLLQVQALLAVGRYPDAYAAMTNSLARQPRSIRLRWLAREVLRSNGQPEAASRMAIEINELVARTPWIYRDPVNLVVYGQAALERGVDPKLVLEKVFATAQKADPNLREVHLASGALALAKHDFALAAKTFQAGLKKLPDDPDLHYGLAQAFEPSDRGLMLEALEAALQQNTNHVPSLLLLADHRIDAEDNAAAAKLIERASAVNPWHPEVWAYRALLADLEHAPAKRQAARETALRFWKTNPRVDHLIGLKLSQRYRFAEGAACQRLALQLDPSYLPAKAQLAQDLLRLGEEAEGWRLAAEVHLNDGYDVTAFNLVTLEETLRKFTTLTNRDFILRMSPHEAAVYGPRVLDLLGRARSALCAKYGLELKQPTIVEMFPEQKDFAVRTFGMPENSGFLGVCFGSVVTANSPAAHAGRASSWESMLWHEFCHVVTLQLTRNRMPRWLSEGISVYEERQASPAWGQRMNPRYREMILNGELTPMANLSAAFLAPPSALHLQFAYYESSLAVEFLVSRFGADRLKAILVELGEGAAVNPAIEKHTAPLATLDKDFAAFAKERAEQLAPGLDFRKPNPQVVSLGGDEALDLWAEGRPTNYWALSRRGQARVQAKQWAEAKAPLETLVERFPGDTGADGAYRLLAAAHRALQETNQERQVLSRLAERDADAADAFLRLMELTAQAKDWPATAVNAERYLGVNPLVAPPYRYLAQAAEAQGDLPRAIAANRALLQLDPPNPAEVHFQLARLLHRAGDPTARRHVLQALEDAPRNRAALQLLLELAPAGGSDSGTPASTRTQPEAKPAASSAEPGA